MKTRAEEAKEFRHSYRLSPTKDSIADKAHLSGQRVGEQRVLNLLRSEASNGVGHHYDSLAFAAVFIETKLKELK